MELDSGHSLCQRQLQDPTLAHHFLKSTHASWAGEECYQVREGMSHLHTMVRDSIASGHINTQQAGPRP